MSCWCLFGHLRVYITITAPYICIIISIWDLASVLFGHSAQRVSYSRPHRTCGPYFLVWAFMQLLNIYPWNPMTPIHLPKNAMCWHGRMSVHLIWKGHWKFLSCLSRWLLQVHTAAAQARLCDVWHLFFTSQFGTLSWVLRLFWPYLQYGQMTTRGRNPWTSRTKGTLQQHGHEMSLLYFHPQTKHLDCSQLDSGFLPIYLKWWSFLRMPDCYHGKNGNMRLFYIITRHSIHGMSVYSKGTKWKHVLLLTVWVYESATTLLFLRLNITGMQEYRRIRNVNKDVSHGAPCEYNMLWTQRSSFGGVKIIKTKWTFISGYYISL